MITKSTLTSNLNEVCSAFSKKLEFKTQMVNDLVMYCIFLQLYLDQSNYIEVAKGAIFTESDGMRFGLILRMFFLCFHGENIFISLNNLASALKIN